MSTYVTFNHDRVTNQVIAPLRLQFTDADDFIIGNYCWTVGFDFNGDAWQVTYLLNEDGDEERTAVPCFLGPQVA